MAVTLWRARASGTSLVAGLSGVDEPACARRRKCPLIIQPKWAQMTRVDHIQTDPKDRIRRVKQIIYGLALVSFPIMLLAGFLMHPDLLSFTIVTTADQLASNFRRSTMFHVGHLIVALSVPLIVAALLCLMERLKGAGAWYGFIGGITGILGAVVLAIDKGALCLVLSAFDTLNDAQFADLVPHLQVIVDKAGLLWVVWLLPLLPIGAAVQVVGLIKERQVPIWRGVGMITGLLLLNNPDIELISSFGAVLMAFGYVPLGIRVLAEARSA